MSTNGRVILAVFQQNYRVTNAGFCSCSAKFSLQVISPPAHPNRPNEEARELEKAAAGDNAAREAG
ncbi:MAG: hypothetical protein ACLTSK_04835 [Christensenellales bacterium]